MEFIKQSFQKLLITWKFGLKIDLIYTYLEFQADKVQPELMFPEIRVSNTIEACLQTEYVQDIMPSYMNYL